jgi:hypothetical protein
LNFRIQIVHPVDIPRSVPAVGRTKPGPASRVLFPSKRYVPQQATRPIRRIAVGTILAAFPVLLKGHFRLTF